MKLPGNNFFYVVLRQGLKFFLNLFSSYRVIGRENLLHIPDQFIIISNHAAYMDTLYYILAMPFNFVVCGAQPKYFSGIFKRIIMNLGNIIKVDNEGSFLSDCRQLLDQGERLLIYPEMGRRPTGLGDFKSWVAGIYLENKVAVLPCYISGTTQFQEPVTITIGKLISPEGSKEKITNDFETVIRELKAQNIKTIIKPV